MVPGEKNLSHQVIYLPTHPNILRLEATGFQRSSVFGT